MPRGCPLGHIRTSTGRTPGRDRGAPRSKTPSGGRFENFKIFGKKIYFRFLGPVTTTDRQGAPYQKCLPGSAAWGGTVLGARAPRKCHFCRLQLAYSRNCKHWFLSYFPCGFRVFGSIFCNIRNGGKGIRTPPKSTPKKSPFLSTHFWPTWSAPTKILALTVFVGGAVPYPMVKRARVYLPPIRRYGIRKIWHNVGGGPVSTERFAGDWRQAW